MRETLLAIAESWCEQENHLSPISELIAWIRERNQNVAVEIHKTTFPENGFWFYDQEEGCIRNQSRSFFRITGYRQSQEGKLIFSQPIILQEEIGYLGILCQEIGGVMHFLMQAKIEPGNVNKIQISPTIQATKSNFMRKHGGAAPPYLEYFLNARKYEIIVDQIQSEQSSRFYKKRNRNIILRVQEEIPVLPSHRWMTLGQIKQLMRVDNLVNMDTRTVLSCIPYYKINLSIQQQRRLLDKFSDKSLFRSVFVGETGNPLPGIYQFINNWKMFSETERQLLPLHELNDWEMRDGELICKHPYPFKVIYCDIEIEGREVKHWAQPLFEATGIATFGLICCEQESVLKFLVKAMPEAGCFDEVELGPTIQREADAPYKTDNAVESFFSERLAQKKGILYDHLLSEEGGRFYHEQNRNVLLKVKEDELPELPEGYFLLDYRTLNELVQINNTLNIQLRNLLSLLEA